MDIISTFLNLVAPPATFFTLMMLLPPYYCAKFLLSAFRSAFKENVAGKVVLITGASSGIGEHIAYQYALRGACLALVARREKRLQEVADRAREYGSLDVLVIPADVSKVDDCRRFIDETINHFGQLNHLVNNAGINLMSLFEDATDADSFRPIMDINFWGTLYPTYFAIPHLRKKKGRIIGITSAGGWVPVPRMSVYNASKAALINFYECLRTEIGSDIGITIVTPGVIESEISQGKYLSSEGQMEIDQDMRDTQCGSTPVAYVEGCAKSIVNGACKGNRYIIEPSWFKALFYVEVFCPEVMELVSRTFLLKGPDPSQRKTLGKMILDVTGARHFLFPASMRSPELKEEQSTKVGC